VEKTVGTVIRQQEKNHSCIRGYSMLTKTTKIQRAQSMALGENREIQKNEASLDHPEVGGTLNSPG
jgi:hydroxyacyl-ACP dehydratase HTD2-like protein with hotdog domain